MLIPSIDLMGGKIVQLVQGARKELEFDNFQYWIDRFIEYPMVQLIDLDAAMGKGENTSLVEMISEHLPCQVGGGIRTPEAATSSIASSRAGKGRGTSRPSSPTCPRSEPWRAWPTSSANGSPSST